MDLTIKGRIKGTGVALIDAHGVEYIYEELRRAALKVKQQFSSLGIPNYSVIASLPSHKVEDVILLLAATDMFTHAPLNPLSTKRDFEFYLGNLQASAVIIPSEDSIDSSQVVEAAALLDIPVYRMSQYVPKSGILPLILIGEGSQFIAKFEVSRSHRLRRSNSRNPSSSKFLLKKYSTKGIDLNAGKSSIAWQSTISEESLEDVDDLDGPAPADIAILLHTSGTTSKPKLVPITHKSISIAMDAFCSSYNLSTNDRHLHLMPLFHIGGIGPGLLSSLFSGGAVVLPERFDPVKFWEQIILYKVTWVTAVPTIFKSVLDRVELDCPGGKAPQGNVLRFLRSAAAPLDADTENKLRALVGVPIINSYAMSEAASLVASASLKGPSKMGSVGLPVGDIEIKILVDNGSGESTSATTGQDGEICLKGSHIFQGYVRDEVASKAAFTSDGWFRTGDFGHVDSDGHLFITSRVKELIIRGGENISPIEIDEVVMRHPNAAEAGLFRVLFRV